MREPASQRAGTLRTALQAVQGAYYLATGVWPLVHVRSFQAVTGAKTDHLPTGREGDHWLVFTVGVLVASIAAALLVAAWRRTRAPEVAVLAIASALSLAAIDVIFVVRGVIAPVYLADAALQAAIVAGWGAVVWRERAPQTHRSVERTAHASRIP